MNMGEVEIKGIDVNLSANIPLYKAFSLLLLSSYSYQDAIDVTDPEEKNYKNQIPYTPRHSGSVSASLENPWVNVTYTLVAAGDRYALPQNIEANQIDSYIEHSLSVNRSFALKKCTFKVQGDILNLTDKTYDIIQYYPMPGRSWRFSLSITY